MNHFTNHLSKSMLLLLLALLLPPPAHADEPQLPTPVLLWPGQAPGATGNSNEDKPAIYTYLPDPAKATGAAILICPGGGFKTRCIDYEGVLIAEWFREHGIAGFVLRYRIQPIYGVAVSTQDANRAMQFLRAHAADYHISPDRLGIIGFSAGADLCARVSFQPLAAKGDATDIIERFSSRPDFQVLAYGASTQIQPTAAAPPTFMYCTTDDGGINGMMTAYTQLRAARVPTEVHFFLTGEHGVGFAQGDPVLGEWPVLMYNWIRGQGFTTASPRVAIRCIAKIDGQPLKRGMVILTPLDPPNTFSGAPPVVCYITNSTPPSANEPEGLFLAPAKSGPVAGKYRIEVRQDALHWLSNARDPMQIRFGRGTLTEADRAEFFAYARARDLEPSIDHQRVYRAAKPGGPDMVIEIKEGQENKFDVEVITK